MAWASECKATQRDVSHPQSSQEEADTKMILHALDAASNGATEINVGYRRVRPLVKTILRALYRSPLCHWNRSAPSSDQVAAHLHRPLAGLGLRHYLPFTLSVVRTSLAALLTRGSSLGGKYSKMPMKQPLMPYPNSEQEAYQQQTPWLPSKSWCRLHVPNTQIKTVSKLRWSLFRKKQAQSEKLPPTQAALREAIMRTNYQALIWSLNSVPSPDLPPPQEYSWKLEDDQWVPIMTCLPPAPYKFRN